MDDLAQHSPWRGSPRRAQLAPPFDSPIIFRAVPVAVNSIRRRDEGRPHRLGPAVAPPRLRLRPRALAGRRLA